MYIFFTFLHKFDFSSKINANFDEAFLFLVSLLYRQTHNFDRTQQDSFNAD